MQQELAAASKTHTLQTAELNALRSERERLLAILQNERAAAARMAQVGEGGLLGCLVRIPCDVVKDFTSPFLPGSAG